MVFRSRKSEFELTGLEGLAEAGYGWRKGLWGIEIIQRAGAGRDLENPMGRTEPLSGGDQGKGSRVRAENNRRVFLAAWYYKMELTTRMRRFLPEGK